MTEFIPKPGVPHGKRFADVYREKGNPTPDDERMRHRIARMLDDSGTGFEEHAEGELGIPTPFSKSTSWPGIVKTWDVDDVLAVVTVYIRYRQRKATTDASRITVTRYLVKEFNRIFEEQNATYRVDPQGGVHYLHDAEFVRSTEATIAGLSAQRYANSLHNFENGQKAISSASPDGKNGIRNVFAAAEGLFRLIFPNSPRLTSGQVALLEPFLDRHYSGNKTASGASAKLLGSFRGWIDACHFYRHEEGKPDDIAQPPLELAIHLMSVGASFIRLLIELDPG